MAGGRNDRVGFGDHPRRGRVVFIVLAVVLSLVLVLSWLQSNADTPRRQATGQQAFVDMTSPLVDRSTATGRDLAALRTDALKLGPDGIDRAVERLQQDSGAVLTEAQTIEVSKDNTTANALLLGTLAQRRAAMNRLKTGMDLAKNPDSPVPAAVEVLAEVGRDVAAADRTYKVFKDSLTKPERPLPDSKWVGADDEWQAGVLTAWVDSIRAAKSTQPVHDIGVFAVTTDPPDVRVEGTPPTALAVIPQTKTWTVQAVVANKGNSAESGLPVKASMVASNGQIIQELDGKVDLAPGQRRTVVFKLNPPAVNTPFKLIIKAGPVANDAKPGDEEFSREYVVR